VVVDQVGVPALNRHDALPPEPLGEVRVFMQVLGHRDTIRLLTR
jgi:hypothetical protein